jgi:hypothetical protein
MNRFGTAVGISRDHPTHSIATHSTVNLLRPASSPVLILKRIKGGQPNKQLLHHDGRTKASQLVGQVYVAYLLAPLLTCASVSAAATGRRRRAAPSPPAVWRSPESWARTRRVCAIGTLRQKLECDVEANSGARLASNRCLDEAMRSNSYMEVATINAPSTASGASCASSAILRFARDWRLAAERS